MSSVAAALPAGADAVPERETWLLRTHNHISSIMHQRFARLFGGEQARLEIFAHPDAVKTPEWAIPLKHISVEGITEETYDVKPAGVTLLKAYLSNQLRSQRVHAFKVKVKSTESASLKETPLLPSKAANSTFSLGFIQQQDAQDWLEHLERAVADATGASSTNGATELRAPTASNALSDSAEPFLFKLPTQAPEDPSGLWKSTFTWNNVSTFQEPGEDGAYAMVSSMKATPRTVFEHLIRLKDGSSAWSVIQDVRVVEQYPEDDRRLIFSGTIGALSGLMGLPTALGIVAKRDVVVEQSWDRDEDEGTFGIVIKSVDHIDVPEYRPRNLWESFVNYNKSVRARILHCGISITPLKPEYWDSRSMRAQDSPESMVTVIVRVDLGGSLVHSNRFFPLLKPLGMLWLGAIMSSVAQTRAIVEQKRFVDPPFGVLGAVHKAMEEGEEQRLVAGPDADKAWTRGRQQGTASEVAEEERQRQLIEARDSFVHEEAVKSYLDEDYYSSPPGRQFDVRGPNYLVDRIKVPSAEPALRLLGVELLKSKPSDNITHISPYVPLITASTAPFLLPIHFKYPSGSHMLHLVNVFAVDRLPSESEMDETPFTRALGEYYAGTSEKDDERRRHTLKLIPRVTEGSWIIKSTVGSTPCLIGTKLTTNFFRGEHYLETTLDISTNRMASNITSVAASAISSLVVDMGFVLEGKTSEHLPEQLLGTVRLNHLDLSEAHAIAKGEFAAVPASAAWQHHQENPASAGLPTSRPSGSVSQNEVSTRGSRHDRSVSSDGKHDHKAGTQPLPFAFQGADAFTAGYDGMSSKTSPLPPAKSSRSRASVDVRPTAERSKPLGRSSDPNARDGAKTAQLPPQWGL